MPERDFKLIALDSLHLTVNSSDASETLRPVSYAFERNVRRLKSMIDFPIALSFDQKSYAKKLMDLLYSEEIDTSAIRSAVEEKQQAIKPIYDHFNRIAASEHAEGVDAWLASQIIAAWTAFETLATDLWITALNIHPHGLSELKGKQGRRKFISGEERYGKDEAKTVPLNLLQKYRYDLSRNMGTILKERFNLSSLAGIRTAYSASFFKDFQNICAVITDKHLDAISAVRNVIVHRGGQIDNEYYRRSRSLNSCPKGDIGTPLLLDAEIVSKLVAPTISLGCRLISTVDEWLLAH
jgi:hypothetical protein